MTITVSNYIRETPSPAVAERVERAEALLDDDRAVAANTAPSGAASAPMLTGVRAELATLNWQIEHAAQDLAEVQRPISRLQRHAVNADLARRDLEAAQSAERDVLGAWLASDMQGPRPQPSKALLEAERRAVETARDAAAARSALPDHQAAVQRASAHRNTLVQRQVEVRKAAVLEAIDEYLQNKFLPALRIFRAHESRVAALEGHYREIGDLATASQIHAIAEKAHRLVPLMSPDALGGRMLVQQLLENPAASL